MLCSGQVAADLYREAVDAVEGEGKEVMAADIYQAAVGNQVTFPNCVKGAHTLITH